MLAGVFTGSLGKYVECTKVSMPLKATALIKIFVELVIAEDKNRRQLNSLGEGSSR